MCESVWPFYNLALCVLQRCKIQNVKSEIKFSEHVFSSLLSLKGQRISMEGELVVVEPCGFLVVVEDDPEEWTFLESAQSGIRCRVTDSKPSVSPSPE